MSMIDIRAIRGNIVTLNVDAIVNAANPIEQAARIAVSTVREVVSKSPTQVTFCCFSDADLGVYQSVMTAGD